MKPTEEQKQLVRNFKENSVKFLLLDRDNAREALTLMAPDHAPLIDFARQEVIRATFVAPDFRHLETDLLLKAPMAGKHGQGKGAVYVYQLIEHQSEPDELAEYRAMRYQLQVFDLQQREWLAKHKTLRGIEFDPVLPVVIYTGTRTWEKLKPLRDLVRRGKPFAEQTPGVKPVFFNLATTAAAKLYQGAGLFGRVLHLMQQRNAKQAAFGQLLAEVVAHVDQLQPKEQGRWQDLLWYLRAMVYHVRGKEEREPLLRSVEEAARSEARQVEVIQMGKTIAEDLIERGMAEGERVGELKGRLKEKQEMVVRLLKTKFKKLPAKIETLVRATTDPDRLDGWADEVVTVEKLTDMSLSNP